MTIENSSKSKRLVKNTALLYLRMIFLMIISLYTSRVILGALGVVDYGIYNVVGGVVTMFSMLSGSLTAAITRFITYELGAGNVKKLRKVFSATVTIQIVLALIIFFAAETVGLWFLNNKLVIPESRIIAANWCYQFSILTFVINLISIPYNSAIVAHERMSAFAYISIYEGISKLIIAFCISLSMIDKLFFYGLMCCLLAVSVRVIYGHYCKRNFEECSFHFVYDKSLLREIFGFAGWNFIGASSAVLRDQGGSMLINVFYGPVVNAAQAVAIKVNTTVQGFVSNFTMSLNPQIVKSYANGEHDYMYKLVYKGSRLAFYMLLIITMPLLFNTGFLMNAWLKEVPDHTILFVRLTLIYTMCESISNPLIHLMLATGKIRNYQIVVGGLQLLNLPLSYLLLKLGFYPEIILVVAIFVCHLCFLARLYMLKRMVGLSPIDFIKKVYINVLGVSCLSLIFPSLFNCSHIDGSYRFILSSVICLISCSTIIYYIGLSLSEREFLKSKVSFYLRRLYK